MSILNDIEAGINKVGVFLQWISNGVKDLQTIYGALSGPVIAASMAVFYDTVKAIAAAKNVAGAVETGNVATAITLSQTTIGLVEKVYQDFVAGEKTVVADFKALNIKL
jgi:hypothetical protein